MALADVQTKVKTFTAAELYQRKGDTPALIAELEAIRQIDPSDAGALQSLSTLYAAQGPARERRLQKFVGIACGLAATALAFCPGVFMTATPRSLAVFVSTLS